MNTATTAAVNDNEDPRLAHVDQLLRHYLDSFSVGPVPDVMIKMCIPAPAQRCDGETEE